MISSNDTSDRTLPMDQEQLQELIDQGRWGRVRQALEGWPVPEVGDFLMELQRTKRAILFRALPRHVSSEVFSYLNKESRNALLDDLTDEETRYLLAELPADDRTQLFEELPGQVTQKLLNLLSPDDLREARFLLGYPEESIGRLMTPDYVAVKGHWTVDQALAHIRSEERQSQNLDVIYVTDESWKLVDGLALKSFVLGDPQQAVEEIMDHSFVSLPAFADREEAVQMMQRYDVPALPVVDSDGVLLGIVTFDDVLDVAQEEATEDFHKAAAMAPLREGYQETGFGTLYRKRVGWLLILVLANIFSGAALAHYEDVITSAVTLIFFLPLLIASAGNAGAQAATLTVRALAMGDVKPSDWGTMIIKEVGVASVLGITMGGMVWALGFIRGGSTLATVVAITMISVVIAGSTIGCGLPFLLNRLKLDPATASAPLITTLADITGVVIYFSLAKWLMGL